MRDVSLDLYRSAAEYALTRGIIIADTKFEFGLDEAGKLVWIDEALTPDSSRFWPADQYRPGSNPPSFDKQFVRDWLEASGWNKQAPGPVLPAGIVAKTSEKYREAMARSGLARPVHTISHLRCRDKAMDARRDAADALSRGNPRGRVVGACLCRGLHPELARRRCEMTEQAISGCRSETP